MDSAVFVRADSTNLPSIDVFTLLEFMKTSDKYNVAEIRGAKAMILKSSTYHAYVPIATTVAGVAEFCRSVCAKMQACPSLFGFQHYPELCPNNCQNVDKSTFHSCSERRGRPKGSVNGRRRRRKNLTEKREKEQQPSQETESNKDGESVESEHSAGSTPPSESGTRPNSPDSVTEYKRGKRRKREPKNHPKLEMKTRGAKLPNFALQMKESHWNKKDVETIYNNTCVKKQSSHDSDSENETNESSSNSRDAKNISDVSDSEEPELKKLKFNSYDDPLPSDNKMFEKDATLAWVKTKLKLSPNPLDWSVDDVYSYLTNTDDCKLKLIADKMKKEEIDGQALIMLDLETIKAFLHMKKEYAMQLCKHITMMRYYYVDNFEENGES